MGDCEAKNYGDYVVRPCTTELREGGFSLEVVVERHTDEGVHMERFPAAEVFDTDDAACEEGYQIGARLIDHEIAGLTI